MIKRLLKSLFTAVLITLVNLASPNKVNAQIHGAGAGETLTLVRSAGGFGAFGPTASNYVLFTGTDGSNTPDVLPLLSQYISWSDTEVTVVVPSGAGTGVVEVINGSQTFTFAPITVNFNVTNGFFNEGASNEYAYIPNLVNANNAGGYTLQMSDGLNSNTAANQSFMRAMKTWICATQVNWTIGTPTNVGPVMNDNINSISFESLPVGTLGETLYSSFSQETITVNGQTV
ncbi:MAG TPA: hypothetical protein VFE53_25155, partial [Mucilaginibacter sp.]|nr:hypothetical protein [Mucilaginibacter sp.]